jgi:hypothetical protein
MPSVKFERPNNVAPATNEDGTRLGIGNFPAGSAVVLTCRYAENYINGTTAPALVQWEGPYLRIRPSFGGAADQGAPDSRYRSRQWKPGEVAGVSGGSISPVVNGESLYKQGHYFEIDAIGSIPIYLPFDAELELYSDLSGAWLFDVDTFNPPPEVFGQIREYAQTRRVAITLSRSLRVPLGCVDWTFGAGYSPAGTVDFSNEEAGKTVGFGSSTINDFGTTYAGGALNYRYPINGNRSLQVTSQPAAPTSIVFIVRI